MDKREIIRSFLCIEIPKEIKGRIGEFISKVKALDSSVKWVEKDSLHITLKFLGEEPRTKVERMKDFLEGEIPELGVKPFAIYVRGIGVFQSWDRPRVIWVGLEGDGITQLKVLRDFAEKGARRLDFQRDEKPFSPHITLGRAKMGKISPGLRKELEGKKDLDFGSFVVRELILMRSQLFPEGPVYTPLAIFPLEGG